MGLDSRIKKASKQYAESRGINDLVPAETQVPRGKNLVEDSKRPITGNYRKERNKEKSSLKTFTDKVDRAKETVIEFIESGKKWLGLC